MTTATRNDRLAAITAAGTSMWLDELGRGLIKSGELARLVRAASLRGVTSNPTNFARAILGSQDYDPRIEELARAGVGRREIFRELAVADIRDACDDFAAVYDDTRHGDGYVSLEVDPDLAFDTARTLAQAHDYWARVDRPNLMIKVPGTDAGLPAIEELLFDGRNVNVTLLFSVRAYERVAEAYIRALERRRAAGLELDVRSVASFFVSRIDTEVDRRLAALGRLELRGRAGLANARAAYRRFEAIFGGPEFAALRAAGAPVQRPLWASTGVKDPAYPDTMYVEGLIGPDTVATLPLATLPAAADHAHLDPAEPAPVRRDPEPDLRAIAAAGIDLEAVCAELLANGIRKFAEPMEQLLDAIENRREALVTSRPATLHSRIPDELEPALAARIADAAAAGVVRRIWSRDTTLWGAPAAAGDRLGWLIAPEHMRGCADDVEAFAAQVRGEGVADVVLLGMGGSSLAPEVIRRSFGPRAGFPRLRVLDSTDAGAIRAVEGAVEPERTLVLVASKSGSTLETRALLEHFWSLRPDGRGFAAITDPGTPLEAVARERGFRRIFSSDGRTGGRFSALSFYGLVPAALTGADVRGVLDRAGVGEQTCLAPDARTNSGLWLGLALAELAAGGRDKLTSIIDWPLEAFGPWLEQLVAESTGKDGRGIVPVVDEPLGAPGMYGEDRTILRVRNAAAPERAADALIAATARADRAAIAAAADGPTDLGRLFFLAEFAVAVAGWALGVDPFDQPNVQEAKDRTAAALDADAPDPPDAGDEELQALLAGLAPPHYLAVMAYAQPSPALDAAATELRAAVRLASRAATTFGYGPRYLHSTGQLHKGGPATGRFLLLVHDSEPDIPVPGAPYTFNRLKHAQATGDFEALRSRGRPTTWLTLRGTSPQRRCAG